ncbi:MAG: Acetylornithine/succinyldiaminopimelate aminotransferase [Chlamydiales bacterium]|nr:Acetylornithine/succinyldiaminopimelate aminotransferase [Chlamydiales bacterium]MCH9620392.1 Acetylornithine/succinyldiaminopimelate aminotransferase [Chlamydiales bacterium]MCH9622962.1 Acetylornithine/succinyldiaminopimelate aminotransferase [Chlamydiales bacterium]
MNLFADKLCSDQELNGIKKQLLERIDFFRQQIQTIAPPKEDLNLAYEKALVQLGSFRGVDLFFPYIGSGMGNGALVELSDGSVKYDLISGIGVHFGHLHPRLVEASVEAACQNLVMQGNLMQNRDSFELYELLIRCSGMDHCFLSTSGVMANENALKLLFHKRPQTSRLLAFENCFAGRTLTMSQVSDRPQYRKGLPLNFMVDYIPFYDWRNPKQSEEIALKSLEKMLKRYPDQHVAFCMELIQGEGGFYPAERSFFLRLINCLKAHDIPLWVDEVQTFGRTDHLFAFQHFKLEEHVDIVTIGKLAQVCATLYKSDYKSTPGLISQTFTSATAQIRCSVAIIQSLLEEGYLGEKGKNMKIRHRFITHLKQMAKEHPDHIEGPFGAGLMIAFTPFKGDPAKVKTYLHALYKAGVIAFTTGTEPTRLRFLIPAGGITVDQIDHVANILEEELIKLKC